MSLHHAVVEWTHVAEGKSYSRKHAWSFDGGLTVPGSCSDAIVRPPFSDPKAVDPEEAVVAAAASCHMLWFLDLAKRAGFSTAHYRDEAVGTLGKNDEGREALVAIELVPTIEFRGKEPSPAELERLHAEAHARCFIAASLKCPIVVRDANAARTTRENA
ncbi:MAG: OsmC family protein [Polyangiaceae bacterium]